MMSVLMILKRENMTKRNLDPIVYLSKATEDYKNNFFTNINVCDLEYFVDYIINMFHGSPLTINFDIRHSFLDERYVGELFNTLLDMGHPLSDFKIISSQYVPIEKWANDAMEERQRSTRLSTRRSSRQKHALNHIEAINATIIVNYLNDCFKNNLEIYMDLDDTTHSAYVNVENSVISIVIVNDYFYQTLDIHDFDSLGSKVKLL